MRGTNTSKPLGILADERKGKNKKVNGKKRGEKMKIIVILSNVSMLLYLGNLS